MQLPMICELTWNLHIAQLLTNIANRIRHISDIDVDGSRIS